MPQSMYSTSKLIAVTEKKFKFDPLFLTLFFRETYEFDTEKVDLATLPGDVAMAVYVSPTVGGKVIRTRGGLTSQIQPGYVKPKHEVNPKMVLRRLPDEDPQLLRDPAYRHNRLVLQNLKDEELAIQQVEEKQAVDAVIFGKYVMTGDQFEPVEVDLQRAPVNNIIQAGAAAWSQQDKATYDPTADLETYALNASGVINIMVMDALPSQSHCQVMILAVRR